MIKLQQAGHRLHDGLVLDLHELCVLLVALQPGAQVEERVLDVVESRVGRFLHGRHGLRGRPRL
jgi:hypothetical protein